MKKLFLESLILSLVCLVSLGVTDLLNGHSGALPDDVILAALLLLPCGEGLGEAAVRDRRLGSRILCALLLTEALLRHSFFPALFGVSPWMHPVLYLIYALWLSLSGYLRRARRMLFSKRNRIFLDYIQEQNRSAVLFLLAIPLFLSLRPGSGGKDGALGAFGIGLLAFDSAVYLILCRSARSGRLPVLFRGRLHGIYQQLCGRDVPSGDHPFGIGPGEVDPVLSGLTESEEAQRQLYFRCVHYMRDMKPFLDPNFKLQDLCNRLGTNKAYLSRTINTRSGRAFPSFVNFFRVQYAISLFRGNRTLRVHDLSDRAGFNSPVTFNTAFKFETGFTPGEYFALLREGERLPVMPEFPSRSRAVER